MTLPSTNDIKFSDLNTEVTYNSVNKIQASKHWVNVVERDGPSQVSMATLRSKKAAYNISLPGYFANGPRNATPVLRVTDLFSYMTDDDWFSVDVAFTRNGWIPIQVWRVFFKFGLNDLSSPSNDRYPDHGYNWGSFYIEDKRCRYELHASNFRKNQDLQIFYDAVTKDVWAYASYFGDDTNYPNSQTIIRRIQYWPPETSTKDQEIPSYNNNGYYTGIDPRIIDFYRRILNREPDQGGATYWQDQLATQAQTIEQIEQQFYNSDEYTNGPVFKTNQVLRVRVRASSADYDALYPNPETVPTHVNNYDNIDWWSEFGSPPNDPSTVSGDEYNTNPNPPPPPSGGGGGGGGCFTANSLVSIASSQKKISDIKIGDFVYSKDRKTMNKVMFIECVEDTHLKALYSPKEDIEPFATINHPLYIDGELTAVDYSINPIEYPWLNIKKTFVPPKIIPAQGKLVYNLWVDGDGTYIVNDYPTTSIIGDGGATRLIVEQGYFTYEQAMNIFIEFTHGGPDLLSGIYLMNKLVGKLNCKPLNKYFGTRLRDNSYPKSKKAIFFAFKTIGKIIRLFK